MTLEPGDIIGLVGDNGAGKSTFIKCIFKEYDKDEGEVLLNGSSIYEQRSLSSLCFFPDQSVYPKGIKIKDYCLLDAQLAGINKTAALKRLQELLELFGLADYLNKTFAQLSAGMQKKMMLVITLVSNPKYIFLDEPTANLDVNSRIELLGIIKTLSQKGIGILITSHIIDELQGIINKLVIIDSGLQVYNAKFDAQIESIQKIYSSVSSRIKINQEKVVANLDLEKNLKL
ncbi:ATP-binding cassette domain-containing protein [Spiroplasma clarkii]|uniref:ATP-binding cassette domain-containing protein n=1 Tax=Spiroplasma clarkii TaxID=2139 RepID=UPI00214F6F8E|nr:ABC transporter ATP-binding protein [Spiroplasma clarkii]